MKKKMFFFKEILKNKMTKTKQEFKAAVRNFYLFVAIYVWKPGIAVYCGNIFRARGCDPVFRHGSSADESNVLRWMCSCQSLHRCGHI